MIPALVDEGADPDAEDRSGERPLCLAARLGSPEVVSALTEADAVPSSPCRNGRSALIVALENGNGEAALVLIEAGADRVPRESGGEVAIVIAAGHGEDEVVAAILETEPAPEQALDLALLRAMQALSKLSARNRSWLEAGVRRREASLRSSRGERGLRLEAAPYRRSAAALLEAGADPDWSEGTDDSARSIAERIGDRELLALMKSRSGGDP
jgi:ankyrin repeat protein